MIDPQQEAAIGWAVTQLLHRAAALNDAERWEELAALYAEDAVLARPSDPLKPISGREAILASMQARAARTARHVLSNMVVDILSPDNVRVTSTVTLFAGPAGNGPGPVAANPVIAVGGFEDILRLTPAGWRIAGRSGSMALEYGRADEYRAG